MKAHTAKSDTDGEYSLINIGAQQLIRAINAALSRDTPKPVNININTHENKVSEKAIKLFFRRDTLSPEYRNEINSISMLRCIPDIATM